MERPRSPSSENDEEMDNEEYMSDNSMQSDEESCSSSSSSSSNYWSSSGDDTDSDAYSDVDSDTEDGTGWLEVEEGKDPGFNHNFTFSEFHGIKHCPPKNSPPADYFHLFFTVKLLDSFVKHTNKYAEHFLSLNKDSLGHSSRMRAWIPVTRPEMLAFIITLINMSLSQRPTISMYWSKSPCLFCPWYFMMFTRNRFQMIMKFFHMVDTSNIPRRRQPNYDPCARFQVLIDHFNWVSQFHYTPREQLAINETVISTNTRSRLLLNFPKKRSVKLWSICESVSHYCLSFFAYKGPKSLEEKKGMRKTGSGYYVVLMLLNLTNTMNKGYHIFANKCFTSLKLAKYLYSQLTFFTGTMRIKRKGIPEVLKRKLDVGGVKCVRKDYLFMLRYRQMHFQNHILLLTTNGKAEFEQRTKKRGKSIHTTNKPKVVRNYIDYHISGADNSEQIYEYEYPYYRKSLKFWKKVALNIFDQMVFNSYILYKLNTDEPLTRYDYTISVVEDLSEQWLALQENRPNIANPTHAMLESNRML